MSMPKSAFPFSVRRFCDKGGRPDCFEIFDVRNDACASFGTFKYTAERAAKQRNEEHKTNPFPVTVKLEAA